MTQELLEILRQITPEEERLRSGNTKIEKEIYSSDTAENEDIVHIDAAKLLDDGKLIQIRTHTRFVHFPVHNHNFVEVVEWKEVEKKDYVLYFGRFSKEKGIETLLEVCKQLPEIPFVFAGSKEKDSRKTYADAMKFFIIFTLLAYLAVMFYMDILKHHCARLLAGFESSAYRDGRRDIYGHLFQPLLLV